MTWAELAKKSLEARARLFEEYKSVNADTKMNSTEKRNRQGVLNSALDEKGEEVRDFTAKAEMEAENRKLGRRIPGLYASNTSPNDPEEREWSTGNGFILPSAREYQDHIESRDISTLSGSAGVAVPTGVYQDFVVSLRQKSSFPQAFTVCP